ncbi:hypothetical protein JTE90_022375 [Oedothorax gibbosus]|uniref:procollagen-proline 4-dioxygenase n=1 Tax=Oedothorax gibbosus TaxID=931172 RepID=A0AAV6UMR2_9ARAC|nr:hypothetical protein JTE90_022375 [Oedothorax gibbosus]
MMLFSTSLWTIVKPEVFTAIADLEPLLHTEGEIVKSLGMYLELEEKRLESVRWLKKEYEKLYNSAIGDVDSFLSNPVNAYLLVKRLTTDWQTTGRLIEGTMSKAVIENITLQALKFPDDEDLKGAASALMRLQDTYLLDTTKLANGDISGTKPSTELSAGDCFELGRQAYEQDDYSHTVLWMQEALDRLEQEKIKTMSKHAILEHMARATYLLGNFKHARKLTQDIIISEPNYIPAYENLRFYDEQVSLQEESQGIVTSETTVYIEQPDTSFRDYERLCRGERIRSLAEESKLFCKYTTGGSFYLLIQPVKVEILSLDPWIVMYHDILSDEDANFFRDLAQPMLKRAKVQNPRSGLLEPASFRVSKCTWLSDDIHPRISYASRMLQEITGLSVTTAEDLHIINYGIGGHYEPHYDFKMPGDVDGSAFEANGNRLATWIYYLSDVDAGGATVFPDIGVQMIPKKGSAGFWYNLRRSGDGDLQTKHAGCPVLAGSKWIANKWIHEKDQEYRRPCSLSPFE